MDNILKHVNIYEMWWSDNLYVSRYGKNHRLKLKLKKCYLETEFFSLRNYMNSKNINNYI